MKSRGDDQLSLPPMPLQKVDASQPPHIHQVDAGDLTLDHAKVLAGQIVSTVLHDTDSPLKEFGDKSQVGRWTRGEENPILARLIQRRDARKAMAKALLRSCDGVRERTVFEFEESA